MNKVSYLPAACERDPIRQLPAPGPLFLPEVPNIAPLRQDVIKQEKELAKVRGRHALAGRFPTYDYLEALKEVEQKKPGYIRDGNLLIPHKLNAERQNANDLGQDAEIYSFSTGERINPGNLRATTSDSVIKRIRRVALNDFFATDEESTSRKRRFFRAGFNEL